MKKITEDMRAALREPLPKEAIKPHPTKNFLNTIKAIYVVERLNDVFGIGEWTIENEVIRSDGKMIVVKSVFTVNDYSIRVEQFGGNDNPDLGDAYKGAATDALTKIGSYLEIGIDVFKGAATGDPVKPQPAKKPLPSLTPTHEKWQGAIHSIYTGETTIEKIKQHYSLSPEHEQLLTAAK
jgi:hypothetical protein